MRVYQDAAVDGWTSPSTGYISAAVSYAFTITIKQKSVCPNYEGSYQASNSARFPVDNEYILYTEDPDARLTEVQYCLFMNAAGTT